MTDARASETDESATQPDCPVFGQPITAVTVRGPTDGVASPCGCVLQPQTLAEPRLE